MRTQKGKKTQGATNEAEGETTTATATTADHVPATLSDKEAVYNLRKRGSRLYRRKADDDLLVATKSSSTTTSFVPAAASSCPEQHNVGSSVLSAGTSLSPSSVSSVSSSSSSSDVVAMGDFHGDLVRAVRLLKATGFVPEGCLGETATVGPQQGPRQNLDQGATDQHRFLGQCLGLDRWPST